MLNKDEQIIADKINDLQDLPAGYTPNLDSKFALLKASLPAKKEKKKRGLVIFLLAAACITFMLMVGKLLPKAHEIKNTNTDNAVVKNVTTKPKEITIEKQPVVAFGKVENNTSAAVKENVKTTNSKTISAQNLHADSIAFAATNSVIKTPVPIDSIGVAVNIAAGGLQPVIVKKHRYSQVDFDDDIDISKPPVKTIANSFKIKFGPQKSEASTPAAAQEDVLKFKHNF